MTATMSSCSPVHSIRYDASAYADPWNTEDLLTQMGNSTKIRHTSRIETQKQESLFSKAW